MEGDTFRSENTIFINLSLPEKAEGHEDDPCYKYATFQVEDVSEYDEVKKQVYENDISWERYDFIDNNGMSNQMAENFNDLDKMSNILLRIICIAGLLILIFVSIFWIKNRGREIGILLAMGKRKVEIIAQIVGEALVISLLSFLIAIVLAPMISDAAVGYLVKQQEKELL